jgi:hypothetical protein
MSRKATGCDEDLQCLYSPILCPITMDDEQEFEYMELRRELSKQCGSELDRMGGGGLGGDLFGARGLSFEAPPCGYRREREICWTRYFRVLGERDTRGGLAKHCPNPECAGLARDGCVAEYNDWLVDCLDCGTRLVSGTHRPDRDIGLEYNELRTVFIAASVVQGHLVGGAIEAEGIPVYIKGEMLQGAVGELSADVQQVEVQVPIEREDQARQIAMRFEGRGE